MPLKVGVVKYVRPSPYEPIVEATIGALKRVFGTSNVIVTHYDLAGLSQAIREGEVDLFLSSSGFYVRMERYGARVREVLSRAEGKDVTLLAMEPQAGRGFRQEILGYSLMSAMGIRGDEFRQE